MKITCPACNASYRLPDERIQGKNRIFKIGCKKCGAEIRVRGVETAEEIGRTTMPFALDLPAQMQAPATLQVWFAGIDGKQVGPLTEGELGEHITAGRLGPGDLVWKKGSSQWMPVREVPPFDELVAEAPPAGEEPKPVEKRSPRRAQTLELSAAMIELLVKLDGQSEGGDTPPAVPVEPPALPPMDALPDASAKSSQLDRAAAIAGEHADADMMDEVTETAVSKVPAQVSKMAGQPSIEKKVDAKAGPSVKVSLPETPPAQPEAKSGGKPADKKPSVVVKPAPVSTPVTASRPQIQPVEPARPVTSLAKPAAAASSGAMRSSASTGAAAGSAPAGSPAASAHKGSPVRPGVSANAKGPQAPAAGAKAAKKNGGLFVAAGVAVVIVLIVVGVLASQGGNTPVAAAETPAAKAETPAAAVAAVAPVVPVAEVPAVAPVAAAATAGVQADAGAAIEADVVAAVAVQPDVAAAVPQVAAVQVAEAAKVEEPKVEEPKVEEPKKETAKKEEAKAEKKAEKKEEAKVEKKEEAKVEKKEEVKKEEKPKSDADLDRILEKQHAKEAKAAEKAEKDAKAAAAKEAKASEKDAKAADAKEAKAADRLAKAAADKAAKEDKIAADKAAKEAKASGGQKKAAADDDAELDRIMAKRNEKKKPATDEPAVGGGDDEGGLNQAAVNQIASKVNKKVLTCVMLGEVEGETALKVTVRVNSDGSVNNAKVLGKFAGTPVAKCVSDAVTSLTFPQSSGPAKKYTLKYAVGN